MTMLRSFQWQRKARHPPERMELARHLVKEFDLKTAADAQNLLKDIWSNAAEYAGGRDG